MEKFTEWWCKILKKNYTVFFLFLFIASIAGGMALKNFFDYSMIVGVGLAMIFLLASAISLGKRKGRILDGNKLFIKLKGTIPAELCSFFCNQIT